MSTTTTKAANLFYLGEIKRVYAASTSYVDAVQCLAVHVQHDASNLIETLNTSEASTTKAPALEAAEAAEVIAASYLTRESVDNPNYLAGNARKISDARAKMLDAAVTNSDHLRAVKNLKQDAPALPQIAQNSQETADRIAEKHTKAKEAALLEAVEAIDDEEEDRAIEWLRAAGAHKDEALRLNHTANVWGTAYAQALAQNIAGLDAESLSPPRAAALQRDIDNFQYAPILRMFEHAEEYLLNFIEAAINYTDTNNARQTVAVTLAHHNVALPGIHTTDEPAELLPVWPHVESVEEAQNVLTALALDLARTSIEYVEEMNPCGEFEVALQELQELTSETLPSRRQTYHVSFSVSLELTPGEAENLDAQGLLSEHRDEVHYADIHVERADY
jgi:hypothetical protein